MLRESKCKRPPVLTLLLALLVILIGRPDLASAQSSSSRGQVSEQAAELFNRMHEQGALGFETAIGGYVYRVFNHVPAEKPKTDLANMRKALEQAKEIRIKNEQALGRTPDVAALDAEIESNLAEIIARDPGKGYQTYAVRYSQRGERYRIEQFALPNDVPLNQLCEELKSGEVSFKPTYIRTWNDKQYAEILFPESASTASMDDYKTREPSKKGFGALSFDNRAAGVVRFTAFGRDAAIDPNLLKTMTSQLGSPATVAEAKTATGDDALVLRVGSPESVSLYLEVTVLPAKGYVIQSAHTKIKGAVMARDDFGGFVQTSAGFWLPTRVTKENFQLDDSQSPFLFSKEEFMAFETPQTNVPLDENTFDLGSSEEFKALPQLKHLLPKGDPYIKPMATPSPVSSSRTFLIAAINIFVIGGMVSFWFYRRRSVRQS